MKALLYCVFALLLLLTSISCKKHKPIPINDLYVPSDVAEVTSLAINCTIPSDTFFKKHFPENGYWDNKKYNKDILQNKVDTATIYVFVHDTLKEIYAPYMKYQLNNHRNNDKTYHILKDWASEIILKKKPAIDKTPIFQMKNLKFKYGYQYVLWSKRKFLPTKIVVASGINMSPVYFNAQKTKAFVYIEKFGGLVSTIGFDIFFEKRNDKWQVVKNDFMWVE